MMQCVAEYVPTQERGNKGKSASVPARLTRSVLEYIPTQERGNKGKSASVSARLTRSVREYVPTQERGNKADDGGAWEQGRKRRHVFFILARRSECSRRKGGKTISRMLKDPGGTRTFR